MIQPIAFELRNMKFQVGRKLEKIYVEFQKDIDISRARAANCILAAKLARVRLRSSHMTHFAFVRDHQKCGSTRVCIREEHKSSAPLCAVCKL